MRIVTSALLAALILTLPLSVIAAPSLQSTIDIKSLALTRADLLAVYGDGPRAFEVVPDRTVSEDRTDGVAVYDVTFARERTAGNLSSGPFEVRSGVARTAQVEDAVLQLESTKEAFIGEGWTTTGVPPLGDETLGLTQTTDGEGGKIAHYSYLFRKGSYILMVGIRGRPEATKVGDVVGLAITVSGRLDKALGSGVPAASSGPSSSGPTSSGSSTRQGTGERVKVVNPDGGVVNVRAEPTTTSDSIAQVTDGTTLDVVGPNRDDDSRTWRNVRTSDGKTGWIASTLVETISAPAPAPSPGPSPGPSRSSSTVPTEPTGSTPPADEPEESTEGSGEASASPSPSPSPASESSSGATFKGSGNGLTVDGTIREPNLSGGKQLVKVHVTRNGRGVANAFVDVTARLDAKRYRAIKVDKTNNDGWTEVEWEMEGPAGTYEVIVEVKTDENGPVTTAKGSFKWK